MHGISQCFYMFIVFENIMFYTICQAPSQNCLKISKNNSFAPTFCQVVLRFDCPAHFGRVRARILIALLRGRTNHIARRLAVHAVAHALFERLFD